MSDLIEDLNDYTKNPNKHIKRKMNKNGKIIVIALAIVVALAGGIILYLNKTVTDYYLLTITSPADAFSEMAEAPEVKLKHLDNYGNDMDAMSGAKNYLATIKKDYDRELTESIRKGVEGNSKDMTQN